MTHDKTKPFINEIQIQIIYLGELIDRASYYEQLSQQDYKILKNMHDSFKQGVNNFINEPEVKND